MSLPIVTRYTPSRGRGIYATAPIDPQTVVEISPVLLFDKLNYTEHGRHTLLDHYTFKWPDGRMALALGIGSLFNHSPTPNTSYTLKTHETEPTIQFTVLRRVEKDEELCIFYGHNLWFNPDYAATDNPIGSTKDEEDDPFDLLRVQLEDPEPEDSVLTIDAWVLDVLSPKDTNKLLEWTRREGLDRELRHLKRIRRIDSVPPRISILLAAHSTPIPPLPSDLAPLLAIPPSSPSLTATEYLTPVPARPALTLPHLNLKNAIWPTVYAPDRPDPEELKQLEWTTSRRRWAKDCTMALLKVAEEARRNGDLPIAALLPEELDQTSESNPTYVVTNTHDTRTSERHGLRHAVMNLVRRVGELQNTGLQTASSSEYLLTNRSLFLTHEPCIMCSMALVHSRVRDVYILRGMPLTGGCGIPAASATSTSTTSSHTVTQDSSKDDASPASSSPMVIVSDATSSSTPIASLPANPTRMVVAQPNINHRYRVWRWRIAEGAEGEAVYKNVLANGIGEAVDA